MTTTAIEHSTQDDGMIDPSNIGSALVMTFVAGFWVYCAYGWWKIRKARTSSDSKPNDGEER